MIPVIVESPFAGPTPAEVERHIRYARAALRDCLLRGESPLASHLLFTQPGVLDDYDLAERSLGIAAGFAWRRFAAKTCVYVDFGVSRGMQQGIEHARALINHPVELRRIDPNLLAKVLG